MHMNVPEWVKPGLYGAAAGAIALAIVGFSVGGWVTGSKATQMASDKARADVLAALVPVCVDISKRDPQLVTKTAGLKTAKSYDRDDLVMKAGWATMPGATEPDRRIAAACAEKLPGLL
jgi:hypothetical protein